MTEASPGTPPGTSRRGFLVGAAGAGVGGLVLSACGGGGGARSGGGPAGTTAPPAPPTTSAALTGDLQFVAMAASLERLAVAVYQSAVESVTTNKLLGVPPAVVTFVKTAQTHHRDHANAFNGMVLASRHPAVSDPDAVLKPVFDRALAAVKSVPDLLRLLRTLENTVAATYQDGMARLSDKKTVMTLASISPVERQHAAVVTFMLGEPLADTFAPTTRKGEEARPATDYRG